MNENNKKFADSLSELLNVVSVIQSQSDAVENISGASRTVSSIIRNINKFPNNLESFNSASVNSTLNGLSSAIKMLHSTNSDINKSLKDSIFNPIFFDNSIFKETERFADPSLIESIKNLAAQNGKTIDVNTFEKEKVNLYIENFLTTIKYTSQVFNAVKGFLNMCKSMNEIDPNNTGVSNVASVFKKSLLSIKLIVGYISNIMDDPDMKNTLDYIAKFQSEVNAYEGREAELMYLQEKMSKGKLDEDDSKRLNDHYKSKPTNIFECLTSLYGSVLEILKSINQFNKLEPANPAALAFNLQLSIWNLNIVISMIPAILQRINTKELKKIAHGLSPRNIETIKSTTTNEDNATQKSDITKTVVDQMTPFQLIQHIFDLIGNLNNIKVINPVKVKIALLSLQVTFRWISAQILNIAASFKKMFNNKAKKDIIDGGKSAVESVAAITGNLAKIATDLETTAKKSVVVLLCIPAILLFVSTIKMITKVIAGSFKNLNEDTKNTRQNINNVSVTILDILKIGLIIIGIATLSAILLPATIVATLVITNIIIFVNLLKILLNNIDIDIRNIKTIRGVRKILLGVIKVGLLIITLAVLGVVLLPATIVATLVIGGIVAFVYLLNVLLKIVKVKVKDILGLIVISIALGILIVIAIEIKKLNDVASQIKWKNLFVIMGAILLVAVFSIMIGLAAMTILPIIGLATIGLLSIVIVVGLIVLVALALQYLQSIQLDSEAVKNNVRLVLGCAKDIINMLVEDETEQPEEEKGWLSNALKSIGGAALDIISIILRFGTLAMTLLCVGMIYLIAGILSGLQNIKLDKEKILTSVQIVMDTAKMITNVLFDKNTPNENEPANDKKGVLQSLIDFVGGSLSALTGLIESIAAVPVLLMTIMSVGMIFVIANMLNKVMEIQLDSEAIRAKINSIIGVAMDISSMINGTYEDPATKPKEEKKGFFAKLGEGAKDMLVGVAKGAMSVVENLAGAGVLASVLPCILSLNTIVSLLDSVNKLQFDPANTKTKVNDIIDVAKSIGVIVSNKDGEIATIDENKVKQYGKFVDYSESYIKTINKLDVSKVKSLGDMYEKMGQFMEKLQDAPINDIADALVNKISPALSDINTSLNKKPAQTSQTTPINSTNNTSNIQTSQTTPNNPVASNQPIKQIDYTSMLENIEDLLEQIKKKLNAQPQMSF